MEINGCKRKGPTPITLDWAKLLPTEDGHDRPPEIIITSNKKPKEKSYEAEDLELVRKSDRELREAIARYKNYLKLCGKLSDGGEKLRENLKRHEDELERRLNKRKFMNKRRNYNFVDEDPPVQTTEQFMEELDPCVKDATLYYPSRDDPDAVEVNHTDMKCLAPEAYLSSTIMNFYIRYLQQPTSSSGSTTCNFHFFSTYFYNKLEKLKYEEDSFRKFRKCWKDVSIFEKAYILLPVHESAHWSLTLVIICFPTKEDEQGPILLHMDSLGLHNSKLICDKIKRDDPDAVEVNHTDMKCLAPEAYLSSTIMNFYIRYLQQPTSSSGSTTCNFHFFSTYFYNKLEKLKYEEDSFRKFRKCWKDVSIFEKAYILLPVHESAHWSLTLVIICFPTKEDEQGPILLHMDSLGLHNSKLICDKIKRFLKEEWSYLRKSGTPLDLPISDEIWENLESKMEHKRVTVPQQKNEYDCGLFVLFYMERFIKQAPERIKKKDLSMFGRQWFRPREASNLRSAICNLLVEEFRKVKEKELFFLFFTNFGVDNDCEETIQMSDSDDVCKRKEPTRLTLDWAKDGDDDRPPNKKAKESSKNSHRTEALILAMKSDRELNETIARIKNNLKLCGKLRDGGEKLRENLKLHEDELERRRKRQLLQKEREKTIHVSDDDGVSRGQKQGDRKSLSSPNFTKLFNKKLDKPEDGDDRPPEIIITSYKKPKESSENSYQTEDLEMVTKSDRELNETIAGIKQSLKQHEDELERRLKRQLLNKADNECEETIQVSDSDDGHKLVAGKGRSRMAVSSSSQEPSRSSKSGLVDSAKQITSNDDKSTSSFSVPNSPQVPPSSNLGPRTRPNYNFVDEDPPVQTRAQFMEELDPCVELLLGLRKAWNNTKMSKDTDC